MVNGLPITLINRYQCNNSAEQVTSEFLRASCNLSDFLSISVNNISQKKRWEEKNNQTSLLSRLVPRIDDPITKIENK